MLVRLLIRATLGLTTALLVPAALAQDAGLSPADAKGWLSRIHEAASQRNYQGTFVFSAAGTVSGSRVAHYCEGREQYERIEMLDGQRRRVYRHNDVVHTLWPDRRTAVIEQRDPLLSFPALPRGGEDRLVEHYELRAQGTDRVAGHDAQVFVLKPRDAHRFGQRLWTDKASGLLLRADVVGAAGEVLETASFTEVTIGVRPQPDSVLGPMNRLAGWRVLRRSQARTELEREGWSLPEPVAGFREISCVKRTLEAAAEHEAQAEVLQTIFSDGLTHVSVFIEPYDARRHLRPMHTAIGATHTLMRRQGDFWITVVGDVPVPTLKKFAAALERRR
jgi:sigma-E factor negative regulatory protein RseB